MCPLDEAGEIRANPWGLGRFSQTTTTWREREGVRRRRQTQGRETGQEKQAGTLQLHKHAKEKKKALCSKVLIVVVVVARAELPTLQA